MFHLKKGQIGSEVHVCCFEQDVKTFVNELTRLPDNVEIIKVLKHYHIGDGNYGIKGFLVQRKKVLAALYWLKNIIFIIKT